MQLRTESSAIRELSTALNCISQTFSVSVAVAVSDIYPEIRLPFTVTVSVALQPAIVAVTVYVVVAATLAIEVSHTVQLRPADGAHEFVVPPDVEAISILVPPHDAGVAVSVNEGVALTVSIIEVVQPVAS